MGDIPSVYSTLCIDPIISDLLFLYLFNSAIFLFLLAFLNGKNIASTLNAIILAVDPCQTILVIYIVITLKLQVM